MGQFSYRGSPPPSVPPIPPGKTDADDSCCEPTEVQGGITQNQGDERYLRLTGGALTGEVTQSFAPVNPTDLVRLMDLTFPDGILTGLGLSLSGGNVLVDPGTWRIADLIYASLVTQSFVLDAQDATYSRFDVLYADNTDAIHMISGSLSLTPLEPSIPNGTIKLGAVLITPTSVTLVTPPVTGFMDLTTNQTAYGLKNFMDGVQSVTMPIGDSSLNLATTQWVQNELNNDAIWFLTNTFSGLGTEVSPYLIKSYNGITSDNTGTYLGGNITQVTDITLSPDTHFNVYDATNNNGLYIAKTSLGAVQGSFSGGDSTGAVYSQIVLDTEFRIFTANGSTNRNLTINPDPAIGGFFISDDGALGWQNTADYSANISTNPLALVQLNMLELVNTILTGMITTTSGTTATTALGTYRLNNITHSIGSTNTTIPAQNATLNRYSILWITTVGTIGITNGTLALDATIPDFPANSVQVAIIYIPIIGGTVTVGGGGKKGTGTVTKVTSANTDILVANQTTTPLLTLSKVNGFPISYYDPASSIQTQLNSKQATLVSGTNIKTINSSSLLGSGNISLPTYANGFGLLLSSNTFSIDTTKIALRQGYFVNQTLHTLTLYTYSDNTRTVILSQQDVQSGKIVNSLLFSSSNVITVTNNGAGFTDDLYFSSNDGATFTLFSSGNNQFTGSTINFGIGGFYLATEHLVSPVLPLNLTTSNSVTSFNTRTGSVTLSSGDVTSALGFTPYDSTNPSGYINSLSASNGLTAIGTDIQLGGTLTSGVLLDQTNFDLSFQSTNSTFYTGLSSQISTGTQGFFGIWAGNGNLGAEVDCLDTALNLYYYGAGSDITQLSLTASGGLFTDTYANIGMQYAADYSANFTARSLIDKGYADAHYGTGSGSVTSVIAGIGLSGGTITTTGTLSVDQTFTPTWTGAHQFNNGIIVSYNATSVAPIFAGETGIQLVGANASDVVFGIRTFGGHYLNENWRANGTAASPTTLLNNDEVRADGAGGYDGTGWSSEAQAAIQYIVSQDWTTSHHGMGIRVNVTPNNSITLTASVLFANDLSLQVKGDHMVGQFMTANVTADPTGYANSGVVGTGTSTARGVQWVGADSTNTSNTIGEYRFTSLYNTSGYIIARMFSGLSGATANNKGGTYTIQTKADGGSLTTALSIDNAQNINIANLTASKIVFTDASKNLTSTGIGTSGQFLKADGSLDSTTYLSTTLANTFSATQTISFTDNSSSLNTHYGLSVTATMNQSSTAGFTDLFVNRTNTTPGSGTQRLLDLQVGGSSQFNVSTGGASIQAGTSTATAYLVSSVGSNYYNGSNGGIASTSNAAYQFLGSGTDFLRVGVYGSGSSALTTGAVYSGFQVGISPVTIFSSGTHAWLAGSVFNAIGTITDQGAAVTNITTAYFAPAHQFFKGTIVAGSGYTNGTYTSVSLTGGSGTGAIATIVVAGTVVTTVTLTTLGSGYKTGDVLSGSFAGGSGFSYTITTNRYTAYFDTGNIQVANGNVTLATAGNGLYIKEGTNATMGNGTLSSGTLVVSTTKVTANSRIFIQNEGGGTLANYGILYVSARSAGTSFTVSSSNVLDTATFSWVIVEPA